MTEREKLLRRLSATSFAAWEIHVYLDTHSDDVEAQKLYKKKLNESNELKREFEKKYGPLTISTENQNEWLMDPWPWDLKEDC